MTTQKWRNRRGTKKCKKWKGIIKYGWLTNDNSKEIEEVPKNIRNERVW